MPQVVLNHKSCDFKSEIWWLEDVLEEGVGILGHREGAAESSVGGSEDPT